MLETPSRYEIDPNERMPQALMLFGEDGVTPIGYCLMQGDTKISEGVFPPNIHEGIERYTFLQQVESGARQEWIKGPKNADNAGYSELKVRLQNAVVAIREHLEEVVGSLSPATWQAMT